MKPVANCLINNVLRLVFWCLVPIAWCLMPDT